MADDVFDRLEDSSGRVILDVVARTLTFERYGSVATEEQKALSPLVIPLGSIAKVECRPGRSTNWFWVVPRGIEPWRGGVWSDPRGLVCGVDPTDFADRVRFAVAGATPVDAEPAVAEIPRTSRRGRFAASLGRALVDGFFNTR